MLYAMEDVIKEGRANLVPKSTAAGRISQLYHHASKIFEESGSHNQQNVGCLYSVLAFEKVKLAFVSSESGQSSSFIEIGLNSDVDDDDDDDDDDDNDDGEDRHAFTRKL